MRLSVLSLPALAGCALACEEVGCLGTLTIHLSRALADDAVVSVVLDGEARDCPVDPDAGTSDEGCVVTTTDGGAEIAIQTGSIAWEVVEVELSEGGGDAVVHSVDPTWGEPFYPNGKACDGPDGGCVSGAADLTL